MAREEARIRKVHKNGSASEKLVNSARLAVLERHLGVPVKRHRNPDDLSVENKTTEGNENEVVFLKAESG